MLKNYYRLNLNVNEKKILIDIIYLDTKKETILIYFLIKNIFSLIFFSKL